MMRQCADCKLDLEYIKVLDATDPMGQSGSNHVDLQYAPAFAEAGWFGKTKGAQPVTCLICPQCRRISLFGD